MEVFIFDTETTWLFNKKEKDLNKQPYIIQFSWILVDMNNDWTFKEISRIDELIKPPISIPYYTSKIHWIYEIDIKEKKNFEYFAETIMKYINDSDIIVWHNISFDENLLKTEIARLKLKWKLIDYCPKRVICTMNESIEFLSLIHISEPTRPY